MLRDLDTLGHHWDTAETTVLNTKPPCFSRLGETFWLRSGPCFLIGQGGTLFDPVLGHGAIRKLRGFRTKQWVLVKTTSQNWQNCQFSSCLQGGSPKSHRFHRITPFYTEKCCLSLKSGIFTVLTKKGIETPRVLTTFHRFDHCDNVIYWSKPPSNPRVNTISGQNHCSGLINHCSGHKTAVLTKKASKHRGFSPFSRN